MARSLDLSVNGSLVGQRSVPIAIVHHANQYLISNGYVNRSGIRSVAGSVGEGRGLLFILDLHRRYKIPANLHVSGTLLEALAWFEPECLSVLRNMYRGGLLELVGSAYGQNIMRFFGHAYNVDQLNEELDLYQLHLGIEPQAVKTFWPPERVWETASMAPVLRDPELRNGGFKYTLIDDRLVLAPGTDFSPRLHYDRSPTWEPRFFHAYGISDGDGLIALPIAQNLRHCIPPRSLAQEKSIESQLSWLKSLDANAAGADCIAIYADDMEKPAAIGWDAEGPSQFEKFICWVSKCAWLYPVQISEWARTARVGESRVFEGGTYSELAQDFGAGELYEKWYFDHRWNPFRAYFEWSQQRVQLLHALGANVALIALAKKHLLASSWETAWHTPASGAHGDPNSDGGPGGSSRAVASHSRHAAVIAEAAYWQAHQDGECHCYLYDIDGDGEEELILKNSHLFAVAAPLRGGRLIALFAVAGADGAMVIGNPSDDWNLKEELNDYMDAPRNHPGALADVGFEHDRYEARILAANGPAVRVQLINQQSGSLAFGMTKELRLSSSLDECLEIEYSVPETIKGLKVEFGLSPDYLKLLREGRSIMVPYDQRGARGWQAGQTAVWIRMACADSSQWTPPQEAEFGHGCALCIRSEGAKFRVQVGTSRLPAAHETAAFLLDVAEVVNI